MNAPAGIKPAISPQHEAALQWTAEGWPIFPCKAGAKEPDTPRGFKDATIDVEQINRWWTEDPERNIGCCPGDLGCIVIDVDPKKSGDASLIELELQHGDLPKTRRHKTPSGGEHIWLHGEALPSSVNKLGAGVDTRARGGYVLLPGSVLVAGKCKASDTPGAYETTDSSEVAEAPEWVSAALRTKAERERAVTHDQDLEANIDRATRHMATVPPAQPGGRGAAAYRHTCTMRDMGLSAETIWPILQIWNERCEPPQDESELQLAFDHALTYAQNDAGSKAVTDPEKTYGTLNRDNVAQTSAHPKPHEPRIIPFSQTSVDRRPWNIPGIQPATGIGFVVSKPNEGKTFNEIYRLLCQARGTDWFGYDCKQGVTILFSLDGDVNNRVAAYRQHAHLDGQDLPFGYLNCSLDLKSREVAEQIVRLALTFAKNYRQELRCITFDTFNRALHGGNENDSGDVGLVLANAKLIGDETGAFVNFTHHLGKDEKAGARGHSSIIGTADALLTIKDGAISVGKMRDARKGRPLLFKLEEVALGTDTDGHPITSAVLVPTVKLADAMAEAEVKPGTNAAAMLDILVGMDLLGTGVCETELRKKFAELHCVGKSNDTAQKAAKRAIDTLVDIERAARMGTKVRVIFND